MVIKKPEQQKLIKNIRRAFGLAWQTDKKLVIWFIFLTAVGALLPIGVSYSFQLLIDELVGIQSAAGIVTVALLSFFAFRYILELIDDNGKIAEEGSHEFLMSQKGVYATMFKKQAEGYVE
ncbi:MAG: hypothetical protein HYX21_01110 [Candidatus Yanofskybacteria bacterium]|nr:hypothetical protein [Candidatus Yanofskybacteria bacterium]